MKIVKLCCFLAVVAPLASSRVKRDVAGHGQGTRQVRQARAEDMVQSVLQWLQGIDKQNTRKTRQETLERRYLPPGNIPGNSRSLQPVSTLNPFHRPNSDPTYQVNDPTYQLSEGPIYQPSNVPIYHLNSPTYQHTGPIYRSSGPTYQPSSPDIGGTGVITGVEIGVITGIQGGQAGYPAFGYTPFPPFITPGSNHPRPTFPPLVPPQTLKPSYPSLQPPYPSSESNNTSPELSFPTSVPAYPSPQPTYTSSESTNPSKQSTWATLEPADRSTQPTYPSSASTNPSPESSFTTSQSSNSNPESTFPALDPGYASPQPVYPSSESTTSSPESTSATLEPTYLSPQPTYPSSASTNPSPESSFTTSEPAYPSPQTTYQTLDSTIPTLDPAYPSQQPTYHSSQSTTPNSESTFVTSEAPYPSPQPTYPSSESTNSSRESTWAALEPGYLSPKPTYPNSDSTNPSSELTSPTSEPVYPSVRPDYQSSHPLNPNSDPSYSNPKPTSSEPSTYVPGPLIPDYSANEPKPFPTYPPDVHLDGKDTNHPPHIHTIDVICAKNMMTITIEFDRQFDGIIYSKGFFGSDECTFVKANSGQTKYSFTVNLNSCGTEFMNGFNTKSRSYLENILVLQNEAGIQEVWDIIRTVRCLWADNLSKALSVAFSVGMLNQEIVTFSGDTAVASLDIQIGKGPFSSPANGLVKIGETMTLVVSVMGDPEFDIQVKDCKARDADSQNLVMLTDNDGCVLKPKLFGAFQKTRQTENTGASILAYAFFSAFKFPDVIDLIIECNVELCKTNCEMCPDPIQKLDPGRRKRDLYTGNIQTTEKPMTIGKYLRIYLPEDIAITDAIKSGIN